jgi:hypothetical protein
MTVADLCQHFQQRELVHDDNWRSYSTRRNYSFLLGRWIIPRWGDYELSEIRTIDVESWLRSLPRARSTCAKIRNLMSVLVNHACRYELFMAIPSSSFAKARRGGPRRMCSSPPKSSCFWIISNFEIEPSFFWRPQPVCTKVSCLPSRQVGRHRLFARHHERDAFDRLWHRWPVQDRGIAEAGASSSDSRRGSNSLARPLQVPQT